MALTATQRTQNRRARLKAEANGEPVVLPHPTSGRRGPLPAHGEAEAAGPPPAPEPEPPELPDVETAAGRRELLRQVLDGKRKLTGAQASSMRVLLRSDFEEDDTPGARSMREFRARPLPPNCRHCGQPIDYGGGSR